MTRSVFQTSLAVAAGALLLSACGGEGDAYVSKSAPAADGMMEQYDGGAERTAAPPPPDSENPAPEGGVMLAYSYSMGVSAPKTAIEPMMKAHEKKCAEAGPSVCQILGASVNRWGDDQVSAYLNLRAAPEWLQQFRTGIAADAGEAGGKLTADTVRTEDLTRYIIDLDARLDAKIALRDRIRTLLETQTGSLSDVLAAERELANVQGEIDSMTAQLAAARARVAMSTLDISYQSDPETSVGLFKPLREALGDFGRTSVASLADAVRFVARAWPYFILALLVLGVVRLWWRGRRKV